jgi:hypothetical protein
MLSGVLRGESPAVDSRPALSTAESTWLDGPRTDAACPRWPPHAMEFMPGADSVVRPVGSAYGLGCGDGGRLLRPLGVPQSPQGPPHDAMRPPHDRLLPCQVCAGGGASCRLCSRQGERRRSSPRDDPGAHQQLPAGGTPFRVHVAPLGTGRLPMERDRDNHGRLPQLCSATRQRRSRGVMIQPLGADHPALGDRHRQQPPLEKVLPG